MNIIIETERLLLRTFTADDALLIYELNLDPEVTRYTGDPIRDLPHAQLVLEQAILPQYALNNYGRWAVHLKSGMDFIGWCGLKTGRKNKKLILVTGLCEMHGEKAMPPRQRTPVCGMDLKTTPPEDCWQSNATQYWVHPGLGKMWDAIYRRGSGR